MTISIESDPHEKRIYRNFSLFFFKNDRNFLKNKWIKDIQVVSN